MKTLKNKILWFLIIGLALFQFAFAVLMNTQGHQNICASGEHCIFESVIHESKAMLPLLLSVVISAAFFFVLSSRNEFSLKPATVESSAFLLRRQLKGVTQRE